MTSQENRSLRSRGPARSLRAGIAGNGEIRTGPLKGRKNLVWKKFPSLLTGGWGGEGAARSAQLQQPLRLCKDALKHPHEPPSSRPGGRSQTTHSGGQRGKRGTAGSPLRLDANGWCGRVDGEGEHSLKLGRKILWYQVMSLISSTRRRKKYRSKLKYEYKTPSKELLDQGGT